MNTTCYENIDKSYFGDFKRNPDAKPLKMDTVFPFAALSNLCLDVYLETEGKNPRNDDSKDIAKEVINKTINKRDGRLLYATYHSKIDNEPYDFTIDFKVNKRTRDDDSHDREDDISSSSTKKIKALNGLPEPVFIKQEKNTDNSENISDANSTVTIKTEKTDEAPKIQSENDNHELELQDLEPWQLKAKLKEQKAKEALLKKEKRDKLKEEKIQIKEEKIQIKEEKDKLKEQRANEALLKKQLKEKEKAQKELLKAQKAKDALLKKQLKEKEKEQKLIDKLQKAKDKEDKIKDASLKINKQNTLSHDNEHEHDDVNEDDLISEEESHAD
jgi:hypothetical protein